MTAKEIILQAVDQLPPKSLDELAHYIERMQQKSALEEAPTALASENALARDWLRPEEDEAWQDL